MDSSPDASGLQRISEKWWLIAMIDDATNEVFYAGFFPSDTVFANMHVISNYFVTFMRLRAEVHVLCVWIQYPSYTVSEPLQCHKAPVGSSRIPQGH